jgi:hypothetical protein
VHVAECPDIGPICSKASQPPQLHDLHFALGEVRAGGSYGVTDRWMVEAMVPAKAIGIDVAYRTMDGELFEPAYADIHHRDETIVGLGDPELLAARALVAGDLAIVGRIGTTIPLGRTEPNPFALGEAGLQHQHIQLGSGTFQPILGVEGVFRPTRVGVQAYAVAHGSFYENTHGYRAGHRLGAGTAVSWSVPPFLLIAALDVAREQPERWDGEILSEGNLGRTDLLLGGDVVADLDAVELLVGVRVPIVQDVVGAQLDMPFVASVAAFKTFR